MKSILKVKINEENAESLRNIQAFQKAVYKHHEVIKRGLLINVSASTFLTCNEGTELNIVFTNGIVGNLADTIVEIAHKTLVTYEKIESAYFHNAGSFNDLMMRNENFSCSIYE